MDVHAQLLQAPAEVKLDASPAATAVPAAPVVHTTWLGEKMAFRDIPADRIVHCEKMLVYL